MTPDLPLLELFTRLREPLKLGFEQYHLLLQALESGFGLGGVDDLKFLCRLLWLKSRHTEAEKQFNEIFDEYAKGFRSLPEPDRKTPKNSPATETIERSDRPTPAKPPELPPKITPSRTPAESRIPAAYRTPPPPLDLTRSEKGFILKMTDFPFLERPLRQKWRQVEERIRDGFTDEIDIDATLQLIARDGLCLDPPRLPRWQNRLQLLFLEDVEGSMTPFRPIVRELLETVEPDRFQRVDHYYFRNVIDDFVYERPKGAEIIPLSDLPLRSNATITIIISDAGAARRGYNPDRIEMTRTFLEYLQPRVKALLWLVPVPADRWTDTTAGNIAEFLNGAMFEYTAPDLNLALSYARRGGRG